MTGKSKNKKGLQKIKQKKNPDEQLQFSLNDLTPACFCNPNEVCENHQVPSSINIVSIVELLGDQIQSIERNEQDFMTQLNYVD